MLPPATSPKSQRTRLKKGPASTAENTNRNISSENTPAPRIWFSKRLKLEDTSHGSAARSVVNPSSGGKGMRLKRPRNRLTNEIVAAIDSAATFRPTIDPKRTTRPNRIERRILVALPA